MLSREKRLVKENDFQRVYQKGRRAHTESYNLNFLPNRGRTTRIGIVVGKKFSKKATERNRAKRVVREVMREAYDKMKPGYDIVIFVKNTNHAEVKIATVRSGLIKLLEKTELMR